MNKRRCTHCREYFRQDTMIVRGLNAFCSNDHLVAHANGTKRTAAVRRKERRTEIPEAVRLQVLDLDRYACRYCGRMGNGLAIHHVYYRSEAKHEPWLNQPHNLITLCNLPCHLDIVHGNKGVYQPLCLQIVWLRTIEGDTTTTIQMLERQNNGS